MERGHLPLFDGQCCPRMLIACACRSWPAHLPPLARIGVSVERHAVRQTALRAGSSQAVSWIEVVAYETFSHLFINLMDTPMLFFILPGKKSHGHGLISIFTLQEIFPKAQQCQPPLFYCVFGTGDETQCLAYARQAAALSYILSLPVSVSFMCYTPSQSAYIPVVGPTIVPLPSSFKRALHPLFSPPVCPAKAKCMGVHQKQVTRQDSKRNQEKGLPGFLWMK